MALKAPSSPGAALQARPNRSAARTIEASLPQDIVSAASFISRLQPYDLAVLHHPHLGAVHLGHSAGFLGGGFHRLCDSIQKYFGISLLLRFAMGAE